MQSIETLMPFAFVCFASFFTLTNPLGTMPVFLTMTKGLDEEQRAQIVTRHADFFLYPAGIYLYRTVPVFIFRDFGQWVPYRCRYNNPEDRL